MAVCARAAIPRSSCRRFSPSLTTPGSRRNWSRWRACIRRVAFPFCHIELKAEKPVSTRVPHQIESIGDHLRKKRLDLGLTQREVADRISVYESTYKNWELNRTPPRIKYYPLIIDFLGYLPFTDTMDRPLRVKIVILRQISKSSQTELAARLGVELSTLCHWEKGKLHAPKRITEIVDTMLSTYIGRLTDDQPGFTMQEDPKEREGTEFANTI